MHENEDPVASALQALRSQPWAGATHNHELEERLMQEFDSSTKHARGQRRRAMAVGLGILLVCGAGFAAAGGVDLVKSWFVEIEVYTPDGGIIQTRTEVIPDEDNRATLTIPDGKGGETTVILEREDDPENGMTTINAEMYGNPAPDDGAGEKGTITITLGSSPKSDESEE